MKNNTKKSDVQQAERVKYQAIVNARMPRSKVFGQCIAAFFVGGAICCIGQFVGDLGVMVFDLGEMERSAFTSIVMIFLGALFTGIGIYDRLGAFAGAGSVVPITGFANSIVAPAMEHKREGLVMGICAELFSFAGPVLVYGTISSIIVGIITLITSI